MWPCIYYPDIGKEMRRRVFKFPSAARENTVSFDQCDDDLLMNSNAHTEPDIKDWR